MWLVVRLCYVLVPLTCRVLFNPSCTQDFLNDPEQGPSLQSELLRRDRFFEHNSYVQKFWDKMYLGGRYPSPVNSNPAFLFEKDPLHRTQVSRAAATAYGLSCWVAAMRNGGVEADLGGKQRDIPLCMNEYVTWQCLSNPLINEYMSHSLGVYVCQVR